jgi:hypothetical protein
VRSVASISSPVCLYFVSPFPSVFFVLIFNAFVNNFDIQRSCQQLWFFGGFSALLTASTCSTARVPNLEKYATTDSKSLLPTADFADERGGATGRRP